MTEAIPLKANIRKQPASQKREIFLMQYRIHRNASRAYREAGYQDGTGIRQNAHRLLTSDYIQTRLAELDEADLLALNVKAEDVVRRYTNIAFADISRITGCHIGCCRYCWGEGHAYQWRNTREYEAALQEAIRECDKTGKQVPRPSNEGGIGFTANRPPNPDCPECDGAGVPRVVFKDTREMTPSERAVFAGVEVTKHGIKYHMQNQMDALSKLAERLSLFKESDKNKATSLAEAFQQIWDQGSKAPLRRGGPIK